jgi:tetratricopeptide (TPR) repeat protein
VIQPCIELELLRVVRRERRDDDKAGGGMGLDAAELGALGTGHLDLASCMGDDEQRGWFHGVDPELYSDQASQRCSSLQRTCMTARRFAILATIALALIACARADRASERAGDASLARGDAAARRDDAEAAMAAYDEALRAYERDGNAAGASRAALGVAGAWLHRGDLARAMAASQLAVERADRAGEPRIQLYTRLGRADLLRRQGQLVAAEETLGRAAGLASAPVDRAWLALKHGILYVELRLDSLARVQLQRVLALELLGAVSREVALAARLNLAWIERRAGELARAMQHVDAAAAIRADDVDVRVNRALILADRGELDAAARELAAAERAASSVESSSWIAYNAAVVAGRRGDLDGESAALQRSIDGVRALSSRAGSFAPDVAASHRRPYLRLIGARARRGDWTAALGLVMELESLALLATEHLPPGRPVESPAARPSPPASAPSPPSVDAVVETWRGRRLAIAVSDEQTLWRLEVSDGRATGRAIGPAAELEARAAALEADPAHAAAAAALGAAIAPPGVAGTRSGDVLDVLLIGAIARAPLAPLTHGGRPVADRTPLARVLGILPRGPRRTGTGDSVVLGDPRADLPSARAEATAVAARLRVTAQLGAAATTSALAAARGARLLHVAAHAQLDARGARLLLADRAVGRGDIAAGDGAPAIVVLASCGGAIARDDAGWGSLAAAFIAAGSDAVIASSWSVDDDATRRFVDALYALPVREHPARALAAAQARSRAVLPARIWAAFTVIAAPPQTSL